MRWLECKMDDKTHVVLMVKDPIGIGRAASCEFSFPGDKEVSRMHAVVELRGQHWYLIDQKSTNGSFVNGQRVTVPFPLKDDDLIQIGEQRLHVKSGLNFNVKDTDRFKYQGYPHFYLVLKVEIEASQFEIAAAHKALTEIYSASLPEHGSLCMELLGDIDEAYEVLGNPESRAEYDATLSLETTKPPASDS